MGTVPACRTLNLHADYRCAHRGACCTAGWPIPLEAPARRLARGALVNGQLSHAADRIRGAHSTSLLEALAADGSGILPVSRGACVFHDPHGMRCDLHTAAGLDALPSACRHFPRICRIHDDAIDVTFSHYCPTVAASLFDDRIDALAIVEAPASCPPAWDYEGQDVRAALPPLLHPRMLMDLDSYRLFECGVVSWCGTTTMGPEALIASLRAVVERLRAWTPTSEPLRQRVLTELDRGRRAPAPEASAPDARSCDLDVWLALRSTIPVEYRPQAPPLTKAALRATSERWMEPGWAAWQRPILRYLASKAFANWMAYCGHGLRTVVAWLDACLSVLRVELALQCLRAEAPLSRARFIAAVQASDLLLAHLARPDVLHGALWSDLEQVRPSWAVVRPSRGAYLP